MIMVQQPVSTFFSTLEDTFGNGIGWSLSPTSAQWRHALENSNRATANSRARTFEHVLDQHRALGDLLVHDKLLIIRSDEENHDQSPEDECTEGGCTGHDRAMRVVLLKATGCDLVTRAGPLFYSLQSQ
jgi:hypothetical protein